MSDFIDKPVAMRENERLDLAQLKTYLTDQLGGKIEQIEARQFPGGFSNLTYLITIDGDEYVLRRPPFGAQIKTAHDMGREFKVLSLLKAHYPKIPDPIVYCEEPAVIGAPFYMMSRAKGIILRTPTALKIRPDEDTMRELSKKTIENMAKLHLIDIHETGLAAMGKPEGYVQRQVEGWTRRYFRAKTDELERIEAMAKWLGENMPEHHASSFVHNDYKYDNIVLDPNDLTNIIAVLDWELSTVGEPMMDFGTTLAYWAEPNDEDITKQFNPSWMPGNLSRPALVDYYSECRGQDSPDVLFYYIFGLFKISVIGQQIYARFRQGHSKDQRFGLLIHVIKALGRKGVLALEKGRVV